MACTLFVETTEAQQEPSAKVHIVCLSKSGSDVILCVSTYLSVKMCLHGLRKPLFSVTSQRTRPCPHDYRCDKVLLIPSQVCTKWLTAQQRVRNSLRILLHLCGTPNQVSQRQYCAANWASLRGCKQTEAVNATDSDSLLHRAYIGHTYIGQGIPYLQLSYCSQCSQAVSLAQMQ